jgi:hypothetical protein
MFLSGHWRWPMSDEDLDYYRRRERQERLAAKSATSLAARRIHQDLALRYSVMLMWSYAEPLAA